MYAVPWKYHWSQVLQQLPQYLAFTFDTHFSCRCKFAVFDCTIIPSHSTFLKGSYQACKLGKSFVFYVDTGHLGNLALFVSSTVSSRCSYPAMHLRLIVRCWGCWFNNSQSYFCGRPILGACHLKKGGTGIKLFNHVEHWWFPRSHFW